MCNNLNILQPVYIIHTVKIIYSKVLDYSVNSASYVVSMTHYYTIWE